MCGIQIRDIVCDWDFSCEYIPSTETYHEWMETAEVGDRPLRYTPILNLVPCVVGALFAVVELVIGVVVFFFLALPALFGSEKCEQGVRAAFCLGCDAVGYIGKYTWSVIYGNVILPIEVLGPYCGLALLCCACIIDTLECCSDLNQIDRSL